MKKKYSCLMILLVLFYSVTLLAEVGDWQTFTDTKDVVRFSLADNAIWGATNGGLLLFDKVDTSFKKYTNADGLDNNQLVAIDTDKHGKIWMAFGNGIVQRFNPQDNSLNTISDYNGLVIADLKTLGDSVFIALSIGISLFDAQRWEVKETYKIGYVNQIFIKGRMIWAATNTGLKSASLDFPNLMAPSAWAVYTRTQGLPDNIVLSLHLYGDKIAVGTASGLSVYSNGAWSAAGYSDNSVTALADKNGSLLAVCKKTSGSYTASKVVQQNSDGSWQSLYSVNSNFKNVTDIKVDRDNRIWISFKGYGLAVFNEAENRWTSYIPDSPGDNNFSSLLLDNDNNLWVTSTHGGVSRYDGEKWLNFSNMNKRLLSNDYRCLLLDWSGRVWAGSWGGGIAIFTPAGPDSFTITEISKERLAGTDDENYIVVLDMKMDAAGNIWIVNYYANNSKVLAVVDSLGNWQYFSTLDGIATRYVWCLEIDDLGRKWVGTAENGIFVYNDNNTPFTKNDDEFNGTLKSSDGLASMVIQDITMDMDGVIYIGTPEGLNTWYDGQVSEYLDNRVINNNINTIMVDGVNNKWVGTSGGLSMLHADGFDSTHYTVATSKLVAENILSLAFNDRTGDLYIGTTNGLSRLTTPYTRPSATLDLVEGYPNPFILNSTADRFRIVNLAAKSSIRIFTAEGTLVRYIPNNLALGSQALWDGRNDKGEYVSSGIYLFQVTSEDGLTSVGKVAVIKP